MKSFVDFDQIKPVYNTDDDVKGFYNSFLSCAKEYKRASAYFSDGFYCFISKGLSELLKGGGTMKLLLSTEIDKASLEQIRVGYKLKKEKSDYIKECINNSIFDLSKIKDDISIVAFLIAIDKLDIHFVFKEEGLFHDKYAILSDGFGNELLLSGSNNETIASVLKNHESFEITPSWGEVGKLDLEKIKTRKNEFDKTWNNEVSSLVVLPMNEVLKEELIDNIAKEKGAKYQQFQKFIRTSIDEEGHIRIQTNAGLEDIKKKYKFNSFIKPFVIKESDTTVLLKPFSLVKDVIDVLNIVQGISEELKIRFVVSELLRKYIEKYYLDLSELAAEGRKIKDHEYLKANTDFIEFTNTVQNLLKRPLKLAQLEAAYHIVKLRRTMNFSVPGSGKTSAILGAYEFLHNLDQSDPNYVDRVLVLGPLNCFKAWKDEFSVVSKQYSKYDVTQILDIKELGDIATKNTVIKTDFKASKIVLVNFDVVTSIDNSLHEVVDDKTMVVFDEIHRIKNYQSEKMPACAKIIDNTKYRVALTGTPLPNGYKDLYCMFNLLFGEYATNYFGMHLDNLAKADKDFEEQGVESSHFNELIFPFFVRVSKQDLDVPPANADHLIYVETTEEENAEYKKILDENENALSAAIKLTELGCIPHRLNRDTNEAEKEFLTEEDSNKELDISQVNLDVTSKVQAFLSEIEKHEGKSVVWCIFTDTIQKLYYLLMNKGYKVAMIYGSTDTKERSEIIDKFNNSTDFDIIITNPHTLAESVSLHKACHQAYYVELNYNLAQYLQSRDRIHRLGLPKDQQTDYYIFINNYDDNVQMSIDYEIYRRLRKKERRMVLAIEGGSLLSLNDKPYQEWDDIIKLLKKNRKKK